MRCTGAKILIEALVEQGVEVVFGYPGGAVLNIYDELYKAGGKIRDGGKIRNGGYIRHILVSHEQHAAHAADGYARATGRVGVCLATSGPGATNLVTGIASAYMDSVPIVAITGNVATTLLGKDSFQEVDIVGITMPIVKHNWLVKSAAELAEVVREAFLVAKSGRPGPVLIDIPKDVTAELADWPPAKERGIEGAALSERAARLTMRNERTTFTDDDIKTAAEILCSASRPMIYAGGGAAISRAEAELTELAETLGAPVAESLMATGIFPRPHPLALGMIGMHGTVASNKAVQSADLVIALGARFSDRVISSAVHFAKNARIIQFDIDPAEINKNIPADFYVIGGIKETLRRTLDKIKTMPSAARAQNLWGGDIAKWKERTPPAHHKKTALHPRFIMEETARVLKAAFPRQTPLVVTDVGQHQMWAAQFYPFETPRSFLTSGGLGTMGYGLGASVGAAVALATGTGRPLVLFSGDGSFRMNCAEMATLTNEKLAVLIVLCNNRVLGMVRQWQALFYEKRFSSTVLGGPPDFVKLAESYSLAASRACDEASFTKALENAALCLKDGRSALIDAHIDQDEAVLPMVPGGKPVDEQILQ